MGGIPRHILKFPTQCEFFIFSIRMFFSVEISESDDLFLAIAVSTADDYQALNGLRLRAVPILFGLIKD